MRGESNLGISAGETPRARGCGLSGSKESGCSKVLNIVLGRGLGAGTTVTGNTKDGGLLAFSNMLEDGGKTDLSGSSVTAGIGDLTGSLVLGTISKARANRTTTRWCRQICSRQRGQ